MHRDIKTWDPGKLDLILQLDTFPHQVMSGYFKLFQAIRGVSLVQSGFNFFLQVLYESTSIIVIKFCLSFSIFDSLCLKKNALWLS